MNTRIASVAAILVTLAGLVSLGTKGQRSAEYPGRTFAPYWVSSQEFDSLIILNNSNPSRVEGRINAYDSDGVEVASKLLLFAARETKLVSLSADLGLADSEGWLEVEYDAHDFDIGAQVVIQDRRSQATVDAPMTYKPEFKSPNMGAVMFTRAEQRVRLGVVNTRRGSRSAVVDVWKGSQKILEEGIRLAPREQAFMQLVAEGQDRRSGPLRVGVRAEGQSGDVIVAVIQDRPSRRTFPRVMLLEDFSRRVSSRLTTANLLLPNRISSTGIPLVLQNTSNEALVVQVSLAMLSGGQFEVVDNEISIPPQDAVAQDLIPMLSRRQLEGLEWLTLDLAWSGQPDDVLASCFTEGGHSTGIFYRNELVDPDEPRPHHSNYPWTIAEGASTEVHIRNPTDQQLRLFAHLFAENGEEYDFGIVEIAPNELWSVDIASLSHEPDARGGTLSEEAIRGQFIWFPRRRHFPMVGRSVIRNGQGAGVISLSCVDCDIENPEELIVEPTSIMAFAGDTEQISAELQFVDCVGNNLFTSDVTEWASYSSTDPSVGTVDANGLATCVAPGLCEIEIEIEEEKTECAEECEVFGAVLVALAAAIHMEVQPCSITSLSVASQDNFRIDTMPSMPSISAGAAVDPESAGISWDAQIFFNRPDDSCSGGPNFDSPKVSGSGTTFSPTFSTMFGGALQVTAACDDDQQSDTFTVDAQDPGKTAIQAEIGNAPTPFDAGDLKRIACQESGQIQFAADHFPLFGPGGDAGIFQICFQRRTEDLWNWKENVQRGKDILNGMLSFADTMPERVRTEEVRGMGPFPDATDFTDEQRRLEAIHRYNAGTDVDDGYWQWDDNANNGAGEWMAAPQGGAGGYVDNVLGRSASCP